MNASLNSPPRSTSTTTRPEELADLSQNNDEALDLSLGLAALAGLRHGQACEDRQRSINRYEDRNHRLHEARMTRLGLTGEEITGDKGEDEMSQQVLIRSPIVHNHYEQSKTPTPEPNQPVVVQPQPTPPNSGLLNSAIIGFSLLAGLGSAGYLISNVLGTPTTKPPVVVPDGYDLKSSIKPSFGEPWVIEKTQ